MELSKIIKSNIKKSLLLSILLTILSFMLLKFINSYKIEATMYVNDKYVKEMNEDAKYLLSSIRYLDYLEKNSKTLSNIVAKTDEYSLSKSLLLEKSAQDSSIKLTFFAKDKEKAIDFAKEYSNLANMYILKWKDEYFGLIVKTLEKQYEDMKSKTNIVQYRDALADSTIFKLVSYKQIEEDRNDIIRINTYKIKSKYNTKIILLAVFCLGFVLPIAYELYKNELKNKG